MKEDRGNGSWLFSLLVVWWSKSVSGLLPCLRNQGANILLMPVESQI